MPFLRFFWRRYLVLYSTSWDLVVLFFIFLLFPFLLFLALVSHKKGSGYFIGIQELCGNIYSTAEALKLKGRKNVSCLAILNKFDVDKQYDYILHIPSWLNRFNNLKEFFLSIKCIGYFVFFLFRKEFFIFYWKRSFFPLNLDFFLLKLARKKITVFHCGDDVRYRSIHNKLMQLEGVDYSFPLLQDITPNFTFLKKFYYQKFPSILNIPIYTLMDIETFLDRPAHQFRVPQISHLPPNLKKKNKFPVIIHAPSNRELKWTDVVLNAINLLKLRGYKFSFHLIENIVNEECVQFIRDADIIIDQPGLWAGRLAIEGMAHACVVLGGNNSNYERGLIKLPIIEFKKDVLNLVEKIKMLLEAEEELLEEIKLDSYKCYQSFYSIDAFVKHLDGVLYDTIQPDLFPDLHQKGKLLECAENSFQKLVINLFLR